MARIFQCRNEKEKAEIGYLWCLETIKKHLVTKDKNALELNGVIHDWYAKFLADNGQYKECLKYLEEAYKIYSDIEADDSEKIILLLNDIGSAYCEMENYSVAQDYFKRAITLGKKLENFEYLGVLYANYGLLQLRQGFLNEAEKYCKQGWRLGHKNNNISSIEQANYCLKQIKASQ